MNCIILHKFYSGGVVYVNTDTILFMERMPDGSTNVTFAGHGGMSILCKETPEQIIQSGVYVL